ncbi:hypothetical protein BH24CHL4_BH24CHL4_14660 [soil metagenome]
MKLRPDRVLGTLLGMSIGDALGMPVEGWPRETVIERYGTIDAFHGRSFDDGAKLGAGEFTDESEGVLCIVESYTANTGDLDLENIRARLAILARGESRRWMNPSTRARLDDEPGPGFPDGGNAAVTGDVACRGIPLGLISAGWPARDESMMKQQAELLAGLTHHAPGAAECIELVAEMIRVIALQEITLSEVPAHVVGLYPDSGVAVLLGRTSLINQDLPDFEAQIGKIGYGDGADQVVATAIVAAANAERFEDAVFVAASQGGASDARAAIAGALAGAAFGTAGIPQSLIDGLEGRVYVMLAAPWFYQTIQLRNAFEQQAPQG